MSHTVDIKTEVRDAEAVRAACQRLALPLPQVGTHRLFSESVTGTSVALPGWNYPVVCDLGTGALKFDNYGGRWGDEQQLHRFLQAYAVEKARIEARRKGHAVTEQTLKDGSIKLTIRVNGGAA
jgi:hypothetical protein